LIWERGSGTFFCNQASKVLNNTCQMSRKKERGKENNVATEGFFIDHPVFAFD
jgi:hypothetical protein